jgi:hypothetical protein
MVTTSNVIWYFTFFADMYRFILFVAFICVCKANAKAQTIPLTPALFFSNIKPTNQFPEKLLSGRTVLVYTPGVTDKDLQLVQNQFLQTGIDAVFAIDIQHLLGGYDVASHTLSQFSKREIHVLAFVQKYLETYTITLATYAGSARLILPSPVWQISGSSLYELLLQVNREALNSLKKQNLLINDRPEQAPENSIISGGRVESFTADLRVDRMAVRLSGRKEEDNLLQEICKAYPFKIEFVADSLTDVQLRQKGFWYVLNAVAANENLIKSKLGYPQSESKDNQRNTGIVYKFYAKKLENEIYYLGRSWDADPYWPKALENFIANIRKELNAP